MAEERKLEKVKALSAYRLVSERYIGEMDSQGMVLEHKKSGAFSSWQTGMRTKYFLSDSAPRRTTVRACPIFWSTVCWRARRNSP